MSDGPVGPALAECPVCGAIGLPEQISIHDCHAFRQWQRTRDGSVIMVVTGEDA